MKYFLYCFILLCVLTSCQDKAFENKAAQELKEHHEKVFQSVSSNWTFDFPSAQPEIETTLQEWNHWQQFQHELQQHPKTSMLAFQMKIDNVAKRADSLSLQVPERFNNPQVKSRLITLSTQLNSLNTYMQLEEVPEKKVLELIKTVNNEISSVYLQLNEIIVKEKIPMEMGEADMIRALDTTRLANEALFEKNLEKTDSNQNQITPKRKPLINKLSRE